jgi:dihydrofolate reductase
MLSIIVAKTKNNIIGKDNNLIWHIPEDMEKFRSLTLDHTIIMGRKTFESIGRVLENRKQVIFTNNPDFNPDVENSEIVHSVEDIKKYIDSDEECFVIGGSMIYHLLMPYVTKMYITEIDKDFEGDAFFPKMNAEDWEVVRITPGREDSGVDFGYQFVEYKRK